jgi:hypothetical protein
VRLVVRWVSRAAELASEAAHAEGVSPLLPPTVGDCIAGHSPRASTGLATAGFEQVSVAFMHHVGMGCTRAIIRATKPTDVDSADTATAPVSRTTLPIPPTPPAAEVRPLRDGSVHGRSATQDP